MEKLNRMSISDVPGAMDDIEAMALALVLDEKTGSSNLIAWAMAKLRSLGPEAKEELSDRFCAGNAGVLKGSTVGKILERIKKVEKLA